MNMTTNRTGPPLLGALLGNLDQEGKARLELLGAMASGMAHDVNNLLGAMMALVSSAHSCLDANHPAAADLELALGACHKGARLTRTVLDYTKGRQPIPERFCLNEVAVDVVTLVERCSEKRAKVALDLTAEPTQIEGDPNALALALLNLCLNSLSAMSEPGQLVLSTRRVPRAEHHWTPAEAPLPRGPFVSIAVADTGCGMDHETCAKVFVPFFGAAPNREGTGLGMTLVLSTVASHNGAVEVVSQPGRGTTVSLHLPAA